MTVEASDSLAQVEVVLREVGTRHLPVLDRGELKGIISDRDLGAWRNREQSAFKKSVSAGEIMSGDLLTVYPEAELAEVIDIMVDHKVGALPVIDASTQALVGIISYIDILRAVRSEL